VEWPGVDRARHDSGGAAGVGAGRVDVFARGVPRLYDLLLRLRVSALVHASSPAAGGGAVGTLLPAQWASFAASPLHAQELQCDPPAGRLVPGNIARALQGELCADARAVGARCAATRRKFAGGGN